MKSKLLVNFYLSVGKQILLGKVLILSKWFCITLKLEGCFYIIFRNKALKIWNLIRSMYLYIQMYLWLLVNITFTFFPILPRFDIELAHLWSQRNQWAVPASEESSNYHVIYSFETKILPKRLIFFHRNNTFNQR